ncbi:MAG: hypothetical protein AB9872_02460 [Solidesulfovibrio sp.]
MKQKCRCMLYCLILLTVAHSALAGAKKQPFGPRAVWTMPDDGWSACLKHSQDASTCLQKLMRRQRATPEALAVNRLLEGEGFMSAFREMGRVDLATMTFPLRANTNQASFLVNGTPALVSTELDGQAVDIASDPAYAELKRAFPEMELWPTSADFRTMNTLEDGGQGFVFAYPLLNGCHACALAGYALVTLDFGPDGVYHGPRLLRLEPAR